MGLAVYRFMTRRLRPLVTTLTVTHTTVRGRRYARAYAKIPPDLAVELAGGRKRALVVALVGPASHLHAQYWDDPNDPVWAGLDPRLRVELELLGNTAWSPDEVVLIPARPGVLRELGLDPGEPLTLEDVVRAACSSGRRGRG